MKNKYVILVSLISLMLFYGAGFAEDAQSIKLPQPDKEGGRPLMQTLRERKTSREFSPQPLSLQVLSDMLWAASGVNRADGHRTAPTAMNMQEIDIYVAKEDGLYLYDIKAHVLIPMVEQDIRALTGMQPGIKNAPVNLIYVADLSKMSRLKPEDADFYSATDTGFISQNVYLYCASAGLVTVVRGWIDKPALAKAMKLRPDQKIILAQTVGYPK